MLSMGRSNYMRFNNPAEAKQLRLVLPHSRISMAPISFNASEGPQENVHLERKPPVAPRKSPRNSCSDDEIGFLGKLTKFEMLAKQNRANCVSPKVFPAGGLTANVPADQILGHSRSSSLASLKPSSAASPLQNLTNLERSRSNTPSFLNGGSNHATSAELDEPRGTPCSRSNTPNLPYQTSTPNQLQLYSSAETYLKTYKPYYRDNNENRRISPNFLLPSKNTSGSDLMSRSLVCQKSSHLDDLGPVDMSQSLIVTKTTTTEFLQLEKFGSSPNTRDASVTSAAMSPAGQNLPLGSNGRRIQPPSPAFNRNPKYVEQKRNFVRVKSPTPSVGSGCSVEELRERQVGAENKRRETEMKRKQAQEERMREQEVERLEKMRLEEILAMCAEYERQSTVDKPRQPNRIITNGSLPRDKRVGYSSPYESPKSPSKNQPYFSFEATKQNGNSVSYENVCVQSSSVSLQNGNLQNRRDQSGQEQEISSSSNPSSKWPSSSEQFFSASISQVRSSNYENVKVDSSASNSSSIMKKMAETRNDILDDNSSSFGTIQLNGTRINANSGNYENFVPVNANSSQVNSANVTPYKALQNGSPNASQRSSYHNEEDSGSGQGVKTQNSCENCESFVLTNGKVSVYENVVIASAAEQNNKSHSTPKTNGQLSNSCEVIENKLAISNDDLLEVIEELSMLSKPKDHCTPKRNNSEKDNAKSNEAKADKEKREMEEEGKKKYIEFLQNEKLHILSNMDALKRSVADIEIQEEEISRELELEKALISAEYESESLKLTQDEGEKIRVQMKINELEREMSNDTKTQADAQTKAKLRVQDSQQTCDMLEEELARCDEEFRRKELSEKLFAEQEILDAERKSFEDLEFHHLEEEARKLATREELQRYLSELTNRIESRKIQLSHLESQGTEATSTATKDAKSLERQKLGHLKRLEEGRNRLRAINDELDSLAQNTMERSEEKRSPSREDFDRISRVTNDSPIVNNQGSLGRKTIESLKEIERNRQLHLAKQGSQVISEERRRVEELKRRVQDEVRSQWEERKMNCTSFNSVESGEESSSYSTGPTESGSGSSDGAEGSNNEKLSPSKLSELTSPSPGPSTNSYSLLPNDAMRDDRRTSIEAERFSSTSCGVIDGNSSRPLSQTSSEMDTLGPLQTVKHREKSKQQRPLTRYLPIKSESLDLRHHIETAGHQLPLIYDVNVDMTSCSGYLSKMSKKFHHWNKRWFVFDRKRKTLSYYSDSSSRKARGVIYFQSIEEVYVDHMNTVKSPQPSLTFVIKTTARLYHLMAPSPEAMRVWVDVVFTGAEGYHEFDHGV
ncbi:uncharacterized protein [Prorops nasuta]